MSKPPRSSNLLVPFETLINRCIAQDLKLAEGLSQHAGKILQLQVTAPALAVYVHFYPSSVLLSFDPPTTPGGAAVNGEAYRTGSTAHDAAIDSRQPRAGQVHASIRGSALAMLSLLTDRSANRSLVNPAIQISGDVEFVQSVYRLFSAMQIDWQEPLSRVIGDVPTHGLEQLLNNLQGFTRQAADNAKRNVDEYLHEESRLVPPRNQVEGFDRELDELRLRLDRLQARTRLLAGELDQLQPEPE